MAILLDASCTPWSSPTRSALGFAPIKPSVYVGQTALTPEQRLEGHPRIPRVMPGKEAQRSPQTRAVPQLRSFDTRAEALAEEAINAERLWRRGLTVSGRH